MIGTQVDKQYNTLLSRRDSLLKAAEVGAVEHSIVRDSSESKYWSAEAKARYDSVLNENASFHQRVATTDAQAKVINMSAEHSRKLMPEIVDSGRWIFTLFFLFCFYIFSWWTEQLYLDWVLNNSFFYFSKC